MNNIFIPKKINVGYQNRSGTYTGRLAYVIYYDNRGKLRKETSWNNWRDKNIPNEEFDNVPTSGFVLNKKVGDYSSGWDHRHAYCRVYDPRNFEFEISIENLLYILENANSIKGKGLEGDFVYGWDGKDLILMPVESPDYKRIVEFNDIVRNKKSIKVKELIIGATYLSGDNTEMIYMGKFDYYDYRGSLESPMHWFAYQAPETEYDHDKREYVKIGMKWQFTAYRNLTGNKLIKCINEVCTAEYANIFERLEYDEHYSPYDKSRDVLVKYTLDEFISAVRDGHKKYYNYADNMKDAFEYEVQNADKPSMYICKLPWCWGDNNFDHKSDYRKRFNIIIEEVNTMYYGLSRKFEKEVCTPMSIEELYDKLQPCYTIMYLKNGNEYRRSYYYGNKE